MISDCTCGGRRVKMAGKTPDGISYSYWRCKKCKEEVLGMKELHELSQKYEKIRKYSARTTRWGLSLGMRIPSEIVKRYKIKNKEELTIIPEKSGFRVVV